MPRRIVPYISPLHVTVADLGPLAHAEVQLQPLTLFVGENNSGKSYLTTLLWALYQAPNHIFIDETVPELRAAVEEGARMVRSAGSNAASVEIPGDPWSELARNAFEPILAGLLKVTFRTSTLTPRIDLHVLPRPPRSARVVGPGPMFEYVDPEGTGHRFLLFPEHRGALIASMILTDQCGFPTYNLNSAKQVHEPDSPFMYLPASRTGFVQLLPELVDRLFSAGTDPRRRTELLPDVTAPVVQFLRFMANPGRPAEQESDLVAMLESHALRGQLRRDADGIGRYLFAPRGQSVELPMGRASAVVSELLPLITLLRREEPISVLFYEEPEAHLHPRLQRLVARALVRLVRRGTRVVVTTHSDSFVQQINNFIKLGMVGSELALPIRPRLVADAGSPEYTDEDYLLDNEVGAYEFRFRDDGRSEAVPLLVREDGVVMPSFNDELIRMAQEATLLDEALAERAAT